ncbi:hypothetical protein [Hymenobacter sp. B81]|uniref:hypothetical protein n=1 Tax=Hymenobacter sp. B81 TaxID=3344878 RepID=UPI0037DCF454
MIIKALLIFLLVALLLRMVMPWLVRWLLTAFVRKQMQRSGLDFGPGGSPFGPGGSPFGPPPTAPKPGPEGQVQVDYVPPTAKPKRQTEFRGGDYVEFEEVK